MRCAVLNCKENDHGYCSYSSYVQINEDGECDSINIIDNEETDDAESNV